MATPTSCAGHSGSLTFADRNKRVCKYNMTAAANIPERSRFRTLSARRDFSLWSRAYDETPNPMLSLEERFLSPILPPLGELDIVDVGCGTGRWLRRMASQSPRSLSGVDPSPEMLERAQDKVKHKASLLLGDATSLPMANQSGDIIIASFVASYVANIENFAAEVKRVARPGCQVFISDLHPDTVVACKWKRSFRAGTTHVELKTHIHPICGIVASFEAAGFDVACLLEAPFGLAELEIFR